MQTGERILRPDPLVGREAEVELLRRRLDDARGGRGAVVLIAGEPGIGEDSPGRQGGEADGLPLL